ncbi:hypothetical protein [Streptomyces sp. NPDC056600]|uniref:hypothetical protein n=1 Tax=Streptomyces sp. NPDC056600 TaxID=3345874 RepID=UPI0036785205
MSQSTQDREVVHGFGGGGVTAIYAPEPERRSEARLVAVEVDMPVGPRVRLGDIELIGRVPSEVRADLERLARAQGAEVRRNWSGDPEITTWGLSMGTSRELPWTPDGYGSPTDRLVTNALVVSRDLADSPYDTAAVTAWRDVRDRGTSPGTWPFTPLPERPRWTGKPLEAVGPLRFGMSPEQVAAALDGAAPAARRGAFPRPWHGPGNWYLTDDEFPTAGVTAHYAQREGGPTLAAVTVHGRTGPQVELEGTELVGRVPSAADTALDDLAERKNWSLVIGCSGDLGSDEPNVHLKAERAGDALVSGVRFCAADWEEHG